MYYQLIHQSSLAEMAYSVKESQIFSVWINSSISINQFRRMFLKINCVNLNPDFENSVV